MWFRGTLQLVRLALRRDRVLLPIWIGAIGGVTAAVVATITSLYASAEERAAGAAFGAANTVSRILDGPASGTEVGAMTMVESYIVLAIFVALMSSQAVVRHTRQDEETGRAELLGACVIGRQARLTAAIFVAAGSAVAVGSAVTAVFLANDLSMSGSVASGLVIAAIGMTWVAVGAVTSQLSGNQRGANTLAVVVLGASFLLRAVGDAYGDVADSGVELTSAWPSWLSPMGWGQQIRPFHQNNWEVFGLFAVLISSLLALAFLLTSRRDFGSGLLSTRAGPASARAWLGTPLGFAWRLQRGVFLSWLIGLTVVGSALGAVGNSADEFAGISEQLDEIFRRLAADASLVDLYFTLMMGFLAVGVAGYAVQALLRMRTEETSGRLEPVMATAVGRSAWLGSHVLIVGLGTIVLLLATGFSGAVAYGVAADDLATGMGLVAAALVQIPAALALGGFVVAVFAVVPRWAEAVSWASLAASVVMGQFGDLLELPQPLLNLSPFTHVPPVPAEPLSGMPIVVLVAVASVLVAAGVFAFRQRDLVLGA